VRAAAAGGASDYPYKVQMPYDPPQIGLPYYGVSVSFNEDDTF
jgi:hypothetical protein